jgi:hypothetical protein
MVSMIPQLTAIGIDAVRAIWLREHNASDSSPRNEHRYCHQDAEDIDSEMASMMRCLEQLLDVVVKERL